MGYSREFLIGLYRTMVRIRLCEEALVEPVLQAEIRTPCHLSCGEEAVAVGICAGLGREDSIFGTHRSHGHFLAKGGGMKELVSEIFTKGSGCCRGRGGSMHLIDVPNGMLGSAPIVGGTISLAVGAALAANISGDGRVAVSFFGDGAAGEGTLYESLNFAALKRLPVVFVCENNLYSTHMPISECRVESDVYVVGKPFCVESHQVDGNDVLAVYETGKRAIEKCRNGQGPVIIECLTYRFRGHVGPDDNIQGCHTDIRPEEELASWLKRDPIIRLEDYLLKNNFADNSGLESIRREAEAEVDGAVRFATDSAYPDPTSLGDYVFAE